MRASAQHHHRVALGFFTTDPRSLVAWSAAGVVCLAAVVALAAVLSRAGEPHVARAGRPIGDYESLLSNDDTDVGLPAGLAPAFTLVSAAETTLSQDARAVRIGARMVDLEIAARARNTHAGAAYYDRDPSAIAIVRWNSALVAAYAGELAASLDRVPSGAWAATLYRYTESEGGRFATVDWGVLVTARRSALAFRPRFLALGNWLEASRVAARRGDRAFLESSECRSAATAAVLLRGISPAARAALERVRALMPADSTGDLGALERALTNALRTVAS